MSRYQDAIESLDAQLAETPTAPRVDPTPDSVLSPRDQALKTLDLYLSPQDAVQAIPLDPGTRLLTPEERETERERFEVIGESPVERIKNAGVQRITEIFEPDFGFSPEKAQQLRQRLFPVSGGLVIGGVKAGDALVRTIIAAEEAALSAAHQTMLEFGLSRGKADEVVASLEVAMLGTLGAGGALKGGIPSGVARKRLTEALGSEKAANRALAHMDEAREAADLQVERLIVGRADENVDATDLVPGSRGGGPPGPTGGGPAGPGGGPSPDPIRDRPGQVGFSDQHHRDTLAGLMEPDFREDLSDQIIGAAHELLKAGGVQYDPRRLVSDQVTEMFMRGSLAAEDTRAILRAQGLDPERFIEDVAKSFRVSVSRAGRQLQRLSVLTRTHEDVLAAGIRTGSDDPAVAARAVEDLKTMRDRAGIDSSLRGRSFWARANDLWRASLVSQLGTAFRNAISTGMRGSFNTAERALNKGFSRILGVESEPDPVKPFAAAVRLFTSPRLTKQQTDAVFKVWPEAKQQMFMRFASDIMEGDKDWPTKYAQAINWANRAQDFTLRRVIFASELDRKLATRGTSLDEVVNSGNYGAIRDVDVEAAVKTSLELTFASQPESQFLRTLVKAVNEAPAAARFAIPFPRFMAESMEFLLSTSPHNLLKVMNVFGNRALHTMGRGRELTKKDVQMTSRALLGAAMFGTAYRLRGSEYAGEKWYELKATPDGEPIDMRPFFPFSAHLFVADQARRMAEGRPTLFSIPIEGTRNMLGMSKGVPSQKQSAQRTKELMEGLTGLSGRTGFEAIDAVVRGAVDLVAQSDEEPARVLQRTLGETMAGFLTPLRQIQDLEVFLDDRAGNVLDVSEDPLLGPIKRSVPVTAQILIPGAGRIAGSNTLEPSPNITRAEPRRRIGDEPVAGFIPPQIARQVPGLRTQPKPLAHERVFDELQMTARDIQGPSSGIPAFDAAFRRALGPLVQQILEPHVQTDGFKRSTWIQKKVRVDDLLTRARGYAAKMALGELAAQGKKKDILRHRLGKMSSDKRALMLEAWGLSMNELIEELSQ